MAASDNLIDFTVIEPHKENIQALPSGRSAKALAQLYSPPLLGSLDTNDSNAPVRQAFEKELQTIDEADDPLDVYDRYVKWTLDAYPSAQATLHSGLLPLLERATKAFQSSSHYKNDPRYLKLWLQYIRLFSDAPREVFVFLARHEIGSSLALYYEEYAAWLESAGRWNQADEVYNMGIEKEATPGARLLRKFGEFERRKEARAPDADEPSSPALPAVRPVLAAKIDSFSTSSPSAAPAQSARSTASKKSKSSKMQIFADSDEPARPESGSSANGWDSIGSLADRKKENTMEAKPWAGEKLKVGKTNSGMQKMPIFKDPSSSILPKHLKHSLASGNQQQCTRNPKNGRMECVFVSLEAVYPDLARPNLEYCFEELRARHRGWLKKDWRQERKQQVNKSPLAHQPSSELFQLHGHEDSQPQRKPVEQIIHAPESSEEEPDSEKRGFQIFQDTPIVMSPPVDEMMQNGSLVPQENPQHHLRQKQRGFQIFEDVPSEQKEEQVLVETVSRTLKLNDEDDENTPPSKEEVDLAKRLRREERANRTRKIKVMDVRHIKNETKTIQLNLDSPTGPKLKRKKSVEKPSEPTMTINTREAMDEIYGIFSQPLPSQAEQTNAEDDDSNDDDYTSGGESTGTGKLSGPASEYGDDTRNEILGSQQHARNDEDGKTEVTGWSDFTTSKHVPKEEQSGRAPESAQSTTREVSQDENQFTDTALQEEVVTPQEENFQTRSVPLPPEDDEPPTAQFRNMSTLPNHRLPFMTPIAEQTESSLGASTSRTTKDYFHAKTPSRNAGAPLPLPEEDDDPMSSPFDELTKEVPNVQRKVLQPIRTKSTKGTISLGKGSVKSQIAAKSSRPSSAEAVQGGPIIKEEQCNPTDPQLRQTILSQIKPSIASFEGYRENLDTTSGRTSEIRKYVKTLAKASRSSVNLEKTAQTLSLPPMLRFAGTDATYTVKRELGAGTFAPVYLVENSMAMQSEQGERNDENRPPWRVGKSAHRKPLEALKMEEPTSAWEFYILRQSHRRLGVSRAAESIVRVHEMHLFRDECFLLEEYRDQGTLLDLLNLARLDGSGGGGMDEVMAMWLTVELLRTVEALHAKQIIHGDLKADNVLVRFNDPGEETDWCPTYFPSGAHGWASKGLCLIDFGRGIDMKQFVPNVAFIADWKTSEADCAEMREMRPWTYQIDYHGLAGIVHSLLFGKYMETIGEKGGGLGQDATKTYRIRESLKRYWQTDIWSELFHLMLNPLAHLEDEEGKKMPLLKGMKASRERMEQWLEENCERGMGLKSMISRIETVFRERRRKSTRIGA